MSWQFTDEQEKFRAEAEWTSILSVFPTKPSFFTLWYNTGAGGARDGTFAWLYSDALTGVGNYYQRNDQGLKIPVLYPGFNAAYPNGAPGWSIAYDRYMPAAGDLLPARLVMTAGDVRVRIVIDHWDWRK